MKQYIDINNITILITGAAGFIGANLIQRLLKICTCSTIVGIDNLNSYYDPALKKYRIDNLNTIVTEETENRFVFSICDISDENSLHQIFIKYCPNLVVHLAAQAGVRHSIEKPNVYIQSNLVGFCNVIEEIRHSFDNRNTPVQHFVYASSSSVYGETVKIPFQEDDIADSPVSLYGATKKSNELLAYSYAKLFDIPCTGLRFFTVYGPAGRPDMAYFSFTNNLIAGKK